MAQLMRDEAMTEVPELLWLADSLHQHVDRQHAFHPLDPLLRGNAAFDMYRAGRAGLDHFLVDAFVPRSKLDAALFAGGAAAEGAAPLLQGGRQLFRGARGFFGLNRAVQAERLGVGAVRGEAGFMRLFDVSTDVMGLPRGVGGKLALNSPYSETTLGFFCHKIPSGWWSLCDPA